MKKLILFTAEPDNFVPVELKKAGDALGLESTILDITHCFLTEGVFDGGANEKSPALTSKIYRVTAEKVDESVNDAPKKLKIDAVEFDAETIVVPRLNEYHLDVKLGMLKRIEASGAFILNNVHSMQLCNDKLMSQVVLNSAGIKTPFTCAVTNEEDLESVIKFIEEGEEQQAIKYPAIIKTLHGTHGVGVMKVDSHASLISVTQTLIKEGLDFMIQEFMEHKSSLRMIMIGDRVLAANVRGQPTGKDEFRTNAHLGSETKAYTPPNAEVELGKRIVELFGCRFCAIDYIIVGEGDDRKIVVLEVNGSPGLEGMQKDWPDKKLAEEVIKYAMGEKSAPESAAELEATPEPEAAPAPEATPAPEVLHDIEAIIIHRVIDDPTEGRVDTGAKTSSLHADQVTFDDHYAKFKRGDIIYKVPVTRIVKVKNVHAAGEHSRRPVVRFDVTVQGQRFNQVEFTLTDRTNMKFEVLIGRNILELLGIPVVVYKNSGAAEQSMNAPESEIEEE